VPLKPGVRAKKGIRMSKDPRKDALKRAWREQEEKKLVDSIPIPQADLKELFDYLERENSPPL